MKKTRLTSSKNYYLLTLSKEETKLWTEPSGGWTLDYEMMMKLNKVFEDDEVTFMSAQRYDDILTVNISILSVYDNETNWGWIEKIIEKGPE